MTRDHEIVLAARAGAKIASLARQYDVTPNTIRRVVARAKNIADDSFNRPRPDEISLRSASTLLDATGYWPDPENAEILRERRMDVLRHPGKSLQAAKELDAWLKKLGVNETL